MNRLAECIADLATVLGEHDRVHFTRLKPGSVSIAWRVEFEAEPKVRERLRVAQTSDDENEITKSVRRINQRLASDNATGKVIDPLGTSVIEFPGKRRFTEPVVGPFNQPYSLDGVPIKIGGERDIVPVHLEERNKTIHICSTTRAIAIDIAKYLFYGMIRAEGVARVRRDADGSWVYERFRIHSFRPLDTAPLQSVVERLRAVPSPLRELDDPLGALDAIRRASDEAD
jgi:hypothetical protein